MKKTSIFTESMIDDLPYKINPEPSRQKIEDLNSKFGRIEFGSPEMYRYQDELNLIRREIGLYVDYNAITDNKDYKSKGERTYYTLSILYSLPIPEQHCDGGSYDRHEWLKHIGAITGRTKNGHEYSQDYYYFSSHKAATKFIDRVNATFHYLNFLKLI
jgi:hypothetical protein